MFLIILYALSFSWFAHFYFYCTLIQSYVFYTLVEMYVFDTDPNSRLWLPSILNTVAGKDRSQIGDLNIWVTEFNNSDCLMC